MFTHQGFIRQGLLFVQASISTHPAEAKVTGRTASRDVSLKVDTGATFTNVTEDVLRALGTAPIHVAQVRSSTQQVADMPVYRVMVSLVFIDLSGTEHAAALPLNVIGIPPMAANLPKNMPSFHRGLLGMDYLKHVRLLCDGPGNMFQLECDSLP